jgi:low temperature requirement protein LtrA
VELARFTPLFVLIWWAWTGHTVFSTRFDTDDVIQRGLTLLQMFAVAVMAANAKDALDSRSSAGFAAAYAAVRLVLVGQYARARHVIEARPLTIRYLAGHGSAAILWLISALVPAPERFWIWIVAFAIDFGTPWLAIPHSVRIPPDAAHLPERFGLFMLILLGESVVAVMHGMESQESWPVSAAVSAFLGMGLFFTIWWWYFDGAGGPSEQPVRTKRDAVRFHIWSYTHFPLYLGTVIAGVGVQRIVTAASHTQLTSSDTLLLTGGVATTMIAITVIDAMSARSGTDLTPQPALPVTLAFATLSVGSIGHIVPPVATIVAMVMLCVAQLGLRVNGLPLRADILRRKRSHENPDSLESGSQRRLRPREAEAARFES